MSDVNVVADGEGWALEVDGQKRDTFSTKSEAIIQGRQMADEEQGELVIHGQDGQIREKDSDGNDPRNVPG